MATGTIAVAGTASDNGTVARVDVAVDDNSPQAATGTTAWTGTVDTTAYADGIHMITVMATDSAGNMGTASLSVDVTNAPPPGGELTDQVVSNPAVSDGLVLFLGSSRMAESGTLSVLLYREELSAKPWARFRDSSSGATSNVALPVAQPSTREWFNARYILTDQRELWVFSGGGPVLVRRYQLSGTPLPTSASLISTDTFGDADSRAGDFIQLASGGLLAVWHQQGQSGAPQGQGIAYRSPSGAWTTIYPLQFIQTNSAWQAVAQHPADGSIWVFSDCDGCAVIGAIHLTEDASGIRVDWTDGTFIDEREDGDNGPDPEIPVLVAAPDASTGTIALAYQSNHRTTFSYSPFVTGSHVAVARIAADGAKSFIALPVYVERISDIALVVRPGETWLAYRPVDQMTLAYDRLYVSKYSSGSWGPPAFLGTLYTPYETVTSGIGRSEFAARLADGKLHWFAA
jgi:hypothetical protein